MKRKHLGRKILGILLGTALLLIPVLTSFAAENAKKVESAGGRSVIVQNVTGGGTAELIRRGITMRVSRGIRLTDGDTLRTGRDCKIYMAADTTTILRLEESSEATVVKTTFGQKLTVNLKKGRMFYNVAKSQNQDVLELMTNNVTIAIRGTSGILSVGNGCVQHQLYDGTVEVYDGSTEVTQVPGQMLETKIGPAQSLLLSTDVRGFTLKDIPASVAQEMLSDQGLMERIISSLPLGDLAERIADVLNGTVFADIVKNNKDEAIFEDTLKKSAEKSRETEPAETETSPTQPTSPTEPTSPTSPTETEPTSPTETEPTSPTEPTQPTSPTEPTQPTSPTEPTQPTSPTETEPVYVLCDWCRQNVNLNDPSATGHTICDCGELLCPDMGEEEEAKHEMVTCPLADGGCGEEYRLCDTEEAAKHVKGTTDCQHCHWTRLRLCVENDEELLKAHTEKQEGICEYCQKEPSYDYLCQKWVDHCLVPCPTCGELYPKCCEEKHKRGH